MRSKVIVLGGSGMLGSMVIDVLARDSALVITATVRQRQLIDLCRRVFPAVQWTYLDAAHEDDLDLINGNDWIVNAIGITKPLIRDDNAFEIERAIQINSVFPQRVAARAKETGARVLQIATDCVYSGEKGCYLESDPHDALDVYGKTKSLGENVSSWVHNLRCSIIGPEPKDFKFLVEWFVRQPRNAAVNGFTNHYWNGITTYHFARIALGIVQSGMELPNLQHLVPSATVTKWEMLEMFAKVYNRKDITIHKVAAEKVIDRTLKTGHPEISAEIWRLAGYDTPPTIPAMLREMAQNPNRIAEFNHKTLAQ